MVFIDNETPLDAENMNKLGNGLETAVENTNKIMGRMETLINLMKNTNDNVEFTNAFLYELARTVGSPITFDQFELQALTFDGFAALDKTFGQFAIKGLN